MDRKKCEYCGEEIHANSKRCPFCGSILKNTFNEEGFEAPPIPSDVPQEADDSGILKDVPVNNMEDKPEGEGSIQPVSQAGPPNDTGSRHEIAPLGNGIKVLLSIISVLPGIGQLIGIIASIIYMSEEHDSDRKSFGKALLTASLVLFVIWGMCCVMMGLAAAGEYMINPTKPID